MENRIYTQIGEILEKNDRIAIRTVFRGSEGSIRDDLRRTLVPVESTEGRHGELLAKVGCEYSGDSVIVTEPVLPSERLIILGGGHVALAVSEFAARCGFRVIVCDDRPAFANEERFPWAEQVLCDTFENCIDRLSISRYDFVVVVTRGHSHDGDCLRKILPGPEPAYTGMIGSRRRVKGLFAQLAEEGFSAERMERICTPIGLNIGSVTPAEIAISILAELIAYKRMPEHADGRCCNASDLQLEMVRYLAEDETPKAIVTVIETKGSTPRGAGAKMSVSQRGQITGTIGGGCSEGDVIRDAIDMIGTGRYMVKTIDMTGEVAEEEGMVCGGTMKVLIEDGTPAKGEAV
ncbi:MAG: XdhC family protein [Blautia sp.]|nr:XdhC family protein [Lachnospiraceae bacterium]MBP3901912.1 XdhC family protein [Blautia sp.]